MKWKGDDLDVFLEEFLLKCKFLKIVSVVKEMVFLLLEFLIGLKMFVVIDIFMVNVSKFLKKCKILSFSLFVKWIFIRFWGGVDGDFWVCFFCGKCSGFNLLGDFFGFYKVKFIKEKMESFFVKDSKFF